MKSPGNWTVARLFRGRPAARELFTVIERYIETLGAIKVEAAKTQVSFGARRKFAWVWLPQMWVKAPEDCVTLTFDLPHPVQSAKVKQLVEPRPGRFTHHVVIRRASQLDRDVKRWLKDAHAFANADRKPRRDAAP